MSLMIDYLFHPISPKFLNRFCLTILIRLRFSRLVMHLFLLHFFPPLNVLLTCLDTALCEQPASLAMNAYHPCERVSMIVFWTTVRSTVQINACPYASTVKLGMSSQARRGQTTPTFHPLDPDEEGPKRRFRVK